MGVPCLELWHDCRQDGLAFVVIFEGQSQYVCVCVLLCFQSILQVQQKRFNISISVMRKILCEYAGVCFLYSDVGLSHVHQDAQQAYVSERLVSNL